MGGPRRNGGRGSVGNQPPASPRPFPFESKNPTWRRAGPQSPLPGSLPSPSQRGSESGGPRRNGGRRSEGVGVGGSSPQTDPLGSVVGAAFLRELTKRVVDTVNRSGPVGSVGGSVDTGPSAEQSIAEQLASLRAAFASASPSLGGYVEPYNVAERFANESYAEALPLIAASFGQAQDRIGATRAAYDESASGLAAQASEDDAAVRARMMAASSGTDLDGQLASIADASSRARARSGEAVSGFLALEDQFRGEDLAALQAGSESNAANNLNAILGQIGIGRANAAQSHARDAAAARRANAQLEVQMQALQKGAEAAATERDWDWSQIGDDQTVSDVSQVTQALGVNPSYEDIATGVTSLRQGAQARMDVQFAAPLQAAQDNYLEAVKAAQSLPSDRTEVALFEAKKTLDAYQRNYKLNVAHMGDKYEKWLRSFYSSPMRLNQSALDQFIAQNAGG